MARPEKFTIDEVKEALDNPIASVSLAAVRLGCERKTIYNYMDRHPELREVLEMADERQLDFAESKLMEEIKSGNTTALIFFLKTKGKKRGYVERQEVSGPEGDNIEIKVKFE